MCKVLGLDKAYRDSVPLNLPIEGIKPFLEAANKSEPRKAMKLVVLGHGRIGKSTLIHRLKEHECQIFLLLNHYSHTSF